MSQYSFPELQNDELLPCLEEMEVPLEAQQLAKPTYDVVKPLFENLLTTLTGITREELNQPMFSALDAFEFPELHDESISARNFFRHLSNLMLATGVKDFGLRDIHKPESARLRRHLSAVVNFAKFREEKLAVYVEMQGRLDGLVEEKKAAEEERAAKEAEVKAIEAARVAEEPEVARVEAEAQQLYMHNQQLNKQSSELNEKVKELKKESNQLADQAQQVKFDLVALKQENERLQSQIVQSPEKFQRSLQELQSSVEGERAMVSEADRRLRDLQARCDLVAKVEKEVAKCLALMGECEEVIGRKKDVSRVVKEMRGRIAADEAEVQQLTATQQHLRRQQASMVEKIQRLEHQAAIKMEAAESNVEEQLKDKEAIEAENAAMDAKLAENEAAVRAATERHQQLAAAHTARVAGVLEKYGALRRRVADYNAGLLAAVAVAAPVEVAEENGWSPKGGRQGRGARGIGADGGLSGALQSLDINAM